MYGLCQQTLSASPVPRNLSNSSQRAPNASSHAGILPLILCLALLETLHTRRMSPTQKTDNDRNDKQLLILEETRREVQSWEPLAGFEAQMVKLARKKHPRRRMPSRVIRDIDQANAQASLDIADDVHLWLFAERFVDDASPSSHLVKAFNVTAGEVLTMFPSCCHCSPLVGCTILVISIGVMVLVLLVLTYEYGRSDWLDVQRVTDVSVR